MKKIFIFSLLACSPYLYSCGPNFFTPPSKTSSEKRGEGKTAYSKQNTPMYLDWLARKAAEKDRGSK